jgi:hypothetical protein
MPLLAIALFSQLLHAAEPELPPRPPADIPRESLGSILDGYSKLDIILQAITNGQNGSQIANDLVSLLQKREYSWANFSTIERRLRGHATNVYLLAVPLRFHEMVTGGVKMANGWRSLAVTGSPPGDLEYFLWVEVGKDQMLAKLKEFGIPSEEANLENLKRTGILLPKPRR